MQIWKYYLAYTLPLSAFIGIKSGGAWTFLTVLVAFVVIPLFDLLIGGNEKNLSSDEMQKLSQDRRFRPVLYLYVPIQTGLLLYATRMVITQNFSTVELVGIVLSTGIVTGGLGITVAHELFHKKSTTDRTLGKLLMLQVCYLYFYIEHNIGHHVNVATPKDPATARLGESVYTFFQRTLAGSLKSAWEIEVQRLQRLQAHVFGWRNQMLWFFFATLIYLAGVAVLGGLTALAFILTQSLIAILLLETINYIEHYGLQRAELAHGRFEKVTPAHSWNANERLTNVILFKLQRHADHHVHPVRPYQVLRHFDASPQLPTGYAGMILLALIPPLWRAVMDDRVLRHHPQKRQGDNSPIPGATF